jgi:hypothetical protein
MDLRLVGESGFGGRVLSSSVGEVFAEAILRSYGGGEGASAADRVGPGRRRGSPVSLVRGVACGGPDDSRPCHPDQPQWNFGEGEPGGRLSGLQ